MTESDLPYVICHMCSTVDGKQITTRFSLSYNGKKANEIIAPYGQISANYKANVVMYGRNTVEEGFFKTKYDYQNHKPAAKHEFFKGELITPRYALLADPEGALVYDKNQIRDQDIIVMLGEGVSEEYMAALREKNISYVFAGKDGYDVGVAFKTLKKEFGVERIIVQGGGTLNGAILKQGLINEISILYAPSIDGLAGVPSIYNYIGEKDELPQEGQALQLLGVQTFEEGAVWIHYRVHKIDRKIQDENKEK